MLAALYISVLIKWYVGVIFFMGKIKYPELREVLSQYPDLLKNYSMVSYLDYKSRYIDYMPPHSLTNDDGELIPCNKDGKTANDLWQYLNDYVKTLANRHKDDIKNFNEYDLMVDLKRYFNSFAKKQSYTKKIIEWLLHQDCLFLSIEFKPELLKKTSEKTRRRYVKLALDNLGGGYIANIDFGKKTNHEHYHCIIQNTNIDYKPLRDKFGRVNGERIIYNDVVALNRYIYKLTSHCLKPTTHNSRILTNVKDTSMLF